MCDGSAMRNNDLNKAMMWHLSNISLNSTHIYMFFCIDEGSQHTAKGGSTLQRNQADFLSRSPYDLPIKASKDLTV